MRLPEFRKPSVKCLLNISFLKNNLYKSNRTAVITEKNVKISYSLLFKDIKNYSKHIQKAYYTYNTI